MMWNLPKPSIATAQAHLDKLFPDDPPGSVLSKIEKEKILELYCEYELAAGRPNVDWKDAGLSAAARAALLGAYSAVSEVGKLKDLRATLKLNVNECPYCGFGEIKDLDHHLQKAHFNCFSIFALNLVPACSKCNGHKPRKPRTDPKKQHIHAYLEDMSQFQFLSAEVVIGPRSMQVKFKIDKVEGMSDELYARLVQHLKDFHLNDRYPAQVNVFLSEQKAGLEFAFEFGGADGVRSLLDRSRLAIRKTFGENDWREALLRALASSDLFCAGAFRLALGYEAIEKPR
ncbi:HNH endonuclease signature motif containing protein [Zoogloea oryzae]|nr:HNH endonuclease signature motif containing protein [Zoogloea oryzae]